MRHMGGAWRRISHFGDDGIVGRGLGRRSEGSGRHTRDGDVP
jgi:hypothetical protein